MENIEKILENTSKQNIKIPPKIAYRVKYTLEHKHKSKWKIYIKKMTTALASLIIVLIGGVTVYAAVGGTISGKPIIEWLGLNFNKEYENYKTEVEGEKISYGETTIELLSKLYDDGMVLLEFDVKIGEEDMKKFNIQENQVLKGIYLTFNGSSNNWIATIDNKEYGIKTRSAQTYNKIADNEYKIYHMYFLTDKELGNKTDFNINILYTDITALVQEVGDDYEYEIFPPIFVDGRMDISLSKTKLEENTDIFVPDCEDFKYKNMTKTVESIAITPMQIILKVSSKRENVSYASIANTSHKDYIGLMKYKAYDQNGMELGIKDYQIMQKITYANGTSEEWEIGDIGTYMNFENAKMELTEYMIVEKKQGINSITIVSSVSQPNINGEEEYEELDKWNINLKETE
mgnify:CR=1 FL=1